MKEEIGKARVAVSRSGSSIRDDSKDNVVEVGDWELFDWGWNVRNDEVQLRW